MKSGVDTAPVAHAIMVDASQVYAVEGSAPVNPSYAPPALPQFQNEGGAREFMLTQGFPAGLQDTFVETLAKIPLRFFILDDSGSMATNDGKRIVQSGGKKSWLQCSRWTELCEALKFHIQFARQACAPTEFRFLNNANPIKIGYNDEGEHGRLTQLMEVLESSPTYGTPLCQHIREVIAQIRVAEPQLRAAGQKACVIIATDGESSDGDIAQAMAPLKDLPVWVVVRLCTDDERVGNYWARVDEQLEVSIDVLDDLRGEAGEVHDKNPWLTYGEPIQRLREFGICIKEIDLLDERKLTPDELRRIAKIIYGGKIDEYPHPELEFDAFLHKIESKNAAAGTTWDPIDRRDKHWIDTKKLTSAYGKGGCSIS